MPPERGRKLAQIGRCANPVGASDIQLPCWSFYIPPIKLRPKTCTEQSFGVPALYLVIQRLLPPRTSRIGRRVRHCRYRRNIQIQHRGFFAIQQEVGYRCRRAASFRETNNVGLERLCNLQTGHLCGRPIVESIGQILAVNGGRNRKSKIVGFVAVRVSNEVGVAGEKGLWSEEADTFEEGPISLRPIVHRRIELFDDVIENRRFDGGKVTADVCSEACVVCDSGIHKVETFVAVVTNHDLHVVCTRALQ